ncbi:MAG: hypothetical protein LBG62_05895 [Candidatus Methanoplasma sp.]|jgi:hypothetical protein|nr:hypothetical protein [Candidatus Methanoplasma sp.]
MKLESAVFAIIATAIMVAAACGGAICVNKGGETEGRIPHISLGDGPALGEGMPADAEVARIESDGFSIYEVTSYREWFLDEGFEHASMEKGGKSRVRMEAQLKVPKDVIGKSHARFDFYDEGGRAVESMEMEVVSTITRDAEFDVIMFFEGERYSAKDLASRGGMEECVIQFVLLGNAALMLLGIVSLAMVVVTIEMMSSDSNGWEIKYKIKTSDDSQTFLFVRINTENKTVQINGHLDKMELADAYWHYSKRNVEGSFHIAAIIEYEIWVSQMTIDEHLAKCIIKADRDSEHDGADIYTKKETDAERVSRGSTGFKVKHLKPVDPKCVEVQKRGIYFDHYHNAASARLIKRNVHVFFGEPKVVG